MNRFGKYAINAVWAWFIILVFVYYRVFTDARTILLPVDDRQFVVGFFSCIGALFALPGQYLFFAMADIFSRNKMHG